MKPFSIHDLESMIDARARSGGEKAGGDTAGGATSYTRQLLDKGTSHCAKKFGEEAVETVIAAVEGEPKRIIAESADLIYHLLVLLKSRGLSWTDVEAALASRTSMSGLAEKAARKST